MTNDSLKKFISSAPSSPGIYIFKNGDRKLYIGKAANLKARLSSYLKITDPRILKMLSVADDIEFHATDSDIEALILESRHIKEYRPPFNIMLRDDKQYFFVVFTSEKFPKIFLTHQPTKIRISNIETRNKSQIQNSKFKIVSDFGFRALDFSYIGPFTDGTALKTTLRYLRRIFPYCTCVKPHNNFCLNYHIGKCLGYCCLKNPVSSIKYQVLREYRKNIKVIRGVLTGRKTSVIKGLEKEMQRSAKEERFEEAIELRKKLKNLKRIFENARIIHNTKYLIRNTESGTKSQNTLKELARLLKLSRVPNRIEGYDISNIQGAHATGSMVTFVGGRPDKNFYRKFKIFKKRTADDTAMLREILERRFKHDEWPLPDLILIDGGKGQLNAARAAISDFQFSISKKILMVALTKDEKHRGSKIYISGRRNSVPLSQLPISVKNLLLQINNEAHRFAISYYRKLHKRSVES